MAYHADFAAVVGITKSLAQSILHVYYTDGEFPARIQKKQKLPDKKHPETGENLPDRFVEVDFFLAEPQLNFEPRTDDRIAVNIRLSGAMTFTSPELETIEIQVQIDFKVAGLLATFDTGTSIQFGVNLEGALVSEFSAKLLSGTDPVSVYYFDIISDLNPVITGAIWTLDTSLWRITPPQLDDVRAIGLVPAETPTVRTYGNSATIGLDLVGLTQGDAHRLIEMFESDLEQGYYRVFSETGGSYDDEYGGTYTEPAWSNIMRKNVGPHAGNLAVCINTTVVQRMFDEVYSQEIIETFEEEKQDRIDKAKQKAKENNEEYKEPKIAKVTIDALNIELIADFVLCKGDGWYAWQTDIPVDFEIKFRFVSTYVEGSTAFVYQNYKLEGLKVEIQSVEIDQPWWLDFMEVMTGIAAFVGLSPGSAVVSGLLLSFLKVFAGHHLSKGESKVNRSIVKQLGEFGGKLDFTLPRTEGPQYKLSIDDVVVDSNGFDMWLFMGKSSKASARLKLQKYPGFTQWPVKDRNPITIELVNEYNFSHPDDEKVRIRWEVFGDDKSNQIMNRDIPLKRTKPLQTNPQEIRIHHADESLEAYEKFIVRCRVYRPYGVNTDELFKEEITIKIADRLKRHKPYVKWSRGVYFKGYTRKKGHPDREYMGWMQEMRHFAIHKTDPDERCQFVDMYTTKLNKDELEYLDELPFPVAEIKNNLDKICEYCFFGGPDKTDEQDTEEKPKYELGQTKPKKRLVMKRKS